jgi:hypothetical protein
MNDTAKKIIVGAGAAAVIATGAMLAKKTNELTVNDGLQLNEFYQKIHDINVEHKKVKQKKGRVLIPFKNKDKDLLIKIKDLNK